MGARTLYIEPGSPWEKGLDREIFYILREAQILTEQYKQTYNHIGPHSSLGNRPLAHQVVLTVEPVPDLAGLT